MQPVSRPIFAAILAAAGVFAIPTGALACPSYNNPTVFGSANVPADFTPDPWVRNVTAGGTVALRSCGLDAPGYVVSRPDYRIQYTGVPGTGVLTIAVEARSGVDTVLLVNDPEGNWHFNDDYKGSTNSALVFRNPLQGQYDIWFGSYTQSSNNPAVLILTELAY